MELQSGETAQWTVRFDPTHHGTFGDHSHAIILHSNDANRPSIVVPTVANVVEETSWQ